jgi:hypothetical protein
MPDNSDAVKKAEAIATELKHRFKARKPDFTPKWSRDWVIPDNALQAADAKVEMQVDSKFPENRPHVGIDILQAWDDKPVPAVPIPPLKLQSKKVVKRDSSRPSHKFTLDNRIWDHWSKDGHKLEYHFDCKIDQTTRRTQKALKVKRWHVQAIDMNPAEAAAQLPFRRQEQANFNSSFAGRADDAYKSQSFVAHSTARALFGSWMKNAYAFVYTGHGCVICGECGMPYKSDDGDGSDAQFGRWTECRTDPSHSSPASTYCVGDWAACVRNRALPIQVSFFHAEHVRDDAIVEVAPKHLVFSVACGGAFETSLYDAFIGRGTKYGVGFQKSTRCDWARDYAKEFFDKWVKTHNCDPLKIPDVFDSLQSKWEAKLQPVLFGRSQGLGSRMRNLGRQIVALF